MFDEGYWTIHFAVEIAIALTAIGMLTLHEVISVARPVARGRIQRFLRVGSWTILFPFAWVVVVRLDRLVGA